MSYNDRVCIAAGRANRALRPGRIPAAVLGVAVLVVACGGNGEQTGCEPAEGTLSADATAEGLGGTYELTLVAGSPAETTVVGTMLLRTQEDSLRDMLGPGGSVDPSTVILLIGTADVDVETVGGVRIGDLASEDPTRPGVVLVQRTGEITLRFGSEANVRGLVRFDGGYFALSVRKISEGGFTGTWASGVTGQDAAGHFCAVRQ